eukprot:scaffold225_cov235-Pinguiococcus_pyrenoidosus.AAC.3
MFLRSVGAALATLSLALGQESAVKFDAFRNNDDKVELPTLARSDDQCLLNIQTPCADPALRKLRSWNHVTPETLQKFRPYWPYSRDEQHMSLAACHLVRQRVAERCGEAAQVALHYRGPLGAGPVRPDGSWLIVGRVRSERVALLPLEGYREHHSCFSAKVFKEASWLEGDKAFSEAKADKSLTFCLPAVAIAGHIKTGTSALWYMLNAHPNFVSRKPKEMCIGRSSVKGKTSLESFLGNLADSTAELQPGQLLLDACLGAEEYETLHVMFAAPPMLRIYVVRAAPETAWSTWNYFCMHELESDCGPPPLTKVGVHYRSPELFHELFMMGMMEKGDKRVPYRIPKPDELHNYYGWEITRLENLTQKDDDLVCLASEERETDIRGFWERIAAAVETYFGVALEPYKDLEATAEVKVNTNNAKVSTGGAVNEDAHKEGEYEITNYRGLLPEDEDAMWNAWKECSQISKRTGFQYPCRSKRGQ